MTCTYNNNKKKNSNNKKKNCERLRDLFKNKKQVKYKILFLAFGKWYVTSAASGV